MPNNYEIDSLKLISTGEGNKIIFVNNTNKIGIKTYEVNDDIINSLKLKKD